MRPSLTAVSLLAAVWLLVFPDITRGEVDFPTPPSVEAVDLGDDEYRITFIWRPGFSTDYAGVAGTFNGWDRGALPMSGPDAEGHYRATIDLEEGEYQYKFVSGSDGWHTDPLNPATAPDGHGGSNSVLRLGIYARLPELEREQGDGLITDELFLHDADMPSYFDVLSASDAVIRFRTLGNDVEEVNLKLLGRDASYRLQPMNRVASVEPFDFFEAHLHLDDVQPAAGTNGWMVTAVPLSPVAYSFVAEDGGTSAEHQEVYPLILDPARLVDTPDWAKDAIWYQIMIDRFRDGDSSNNPEQTTGTGRSEITHPWTSEWYVEQPWERQNGQTFWRWSVFQRLYGGDFQGLIDKLDYLKDLGVTAIYLNPVFESTSHHKYNGKSYVHADDGYGVAGQFAQSVAKEDLLDSSTWEMNPSDQKLLELIAEVHARDMKIIFDGVFNHLGDDSVPFLDVRANKQDSPFAGWFDVTSWDPFQYNGWAGFGGLPAFKKTSTGLADSSLTRHIFDATQRWMDPNGDGDPSDGIDGWRLDVPNELPKRFWVAWRRHVKSINPDAYISGEIWDPAEEWLDGTAFDAVMNYELARIAFRYFGNVNQKISATEFDNQLARLRLRYPLASTQVLQNLFDSHDTDRWVSRLANPDLPYDGSNRIQDSGPNYDDTRPGEEEYRKMRLMALFQATYVGAPMIWYGTEVGMYGADDPMDRMPMWWEDLMPYDNPDYIILDDLRQHFRTLFHLRQSHPVLSRGDFLTLAANDSADTYAYLRHSPEEAESIVVVLNNSTSPRTVTLQAPHSSLLPRGFTEAEILFGSPEALEAHSAGELTVQVPPVDGVIILIDGSSGGDN